MAKLPRKLPALALQVQASAFAFVIALAVAIVSLSSGLSHALEADIRQARDQLRAGATQSDLVIVEVDGHSLQRIAKWPWPRSNYAFAVEELNRLGAHQIAFDIEFSARSSTDQDAAFATALNASEASIILPTFRQVNQAAADNAISEALPLPELRENAFLASVNVDPDANGQVTQYRYGTVTGGVPRPSLASMISGTSGDIAQSFRVDQAISPTSFDRISFVDLMEQNVAASRVNGKRILIGATAIELGDRYPTSLYGVQPGVVVQAQAAETLIQDRVRFDVAQIAMLGLAALLVLATILKEAWQRYTLLAAFASSGCMVIAALVADAMHWAYLPLASATLFGIAFATAQCVIQLIQNLTAARLTDLASGLGNARALSDALHTNLERSIATARIADYDQLLAVTAENASGGLDKAIAWRLQMLAVDERIYRIEGGVFGWLIPAERGEDFEDYFASANALFNAAIDLGGQPLRAKPSFGVSANSISDAIFASEHARQHSLRWSSSAHAMTQKSKFEQTVLAELDEALRKGAITVVYQPKLNLKTHTITSAECLVRWTSPTLGQISPGEFIPLLETKDTIDKLTLFVLDKAISRAKEAAQFGHELNLAVNISAQLLSDQDFVSAVAVRLKQLTELPGTPITLEVTESAPLDDPHAAQTALSNLRKAGARISVDDYGTGHATLNYLKDFPADEIKLDQSFITDLTTNNANRLMVRSTVELAHALSFNVVAEGVEDEVTLQALDAMGCDYLQGWHIGKPMAWDDFLESLMDKSQPLRASA